MAAAIAVVVAALSAAGLQSPWQKYSEHCPTINPELETHCRQYRGQRWYVVRRRGHARWQRLNDDAWFVLSHCNGDNNLVQLQRLSRDSEHIEALSEQQLLALVQQFQCAGLLLAPVAASNDLPPLTSGWRSWLKNPLAIRLPLWDPSALLDRVAIPLLRLPWSLLFWLWLGLLLVTAFSAASHWPAITEDVASRVLRPGNMLFIALLLPFTKFLHESGHALATRLQGGAVQEVGVMFMFGMPLPYVETSAAHSFASHRARLRVDLAGIAVELTLACLALWLWLHIGDGLLRQLAFNVMLICSVSTLFFNANPLMRFDGYYVLSDTLQLPNLATRAAGFWRYLFKRHLFAIADASFSAGATERRWLGLYGVLAWCYRWLVLFFILILAAKISMLVALPLALLLSYQQLIKPLIQLYHFVGKSRQLGVGSALELKLALAVAVVLAFLLLFPMPLSRTAEAVLALAPGAQLRATAPGQLLTLEVEPGQPVTAGRLLVTLGDELLSTETELAQARLQELRARFDAARIEDRERAEQLEEDLAVAQQLLDKLLGQQRELQLAAATAGYFYPPPGQLMIGRYVTEGELLGYVIDRRRLRLRVMMAQEDVSLLRRGIAGIDVRLLSQPGRLFEGQLLKVHPSMTRQLPSAALAAVNGGNIATEPLDGGQLQAVDEWFELELAVDAQGSAWPGELALVQFDLGYMSVFQQIYRELRQLFISELSL